MHERVSTRSGDSTKCGRERRWWLRRPGPICIETSTGARRCFAPSTWRPASWPCSRQRSNVCRGRCTTRSTSSYSPLSPRLRPRGPRRIGLKSLCFLTSGRSRIHCWQRPQPGASRRLHASSCATPVPRSTRISAGRLARRARPTRVINGSGRFRSLGVCAAGNSDRYL